MTGDDRAQPVAFLRAALGGGGEVSASHSDRLSHASDASHFHLVPQLVATPRNPGAVGALLRASKEQGLHLTFRSGGTSLSGQGVTDGVLVDVRRHFRTVEVLDDGARVRVQGGATLRAVNARLAPYHRKLGPDPASEIACTVGGVVANNSSGMACGTTDNAYQTLESMVVVLPSGTVVDTGAVDAEDRLRTLEPVVYEGLSRLRDRVRGNASSVATIRRLFAMKNTMGYGVNAFLDHDRVADVLAHLVIGSEGTLAFLASATFRTVPVVPHALTGLLVFDDLAAATGSLPELLESAPATVELLDAVSLDVARLNPVDAALVPAAVQGSRPAALLVEYQEADRQSLQAAASRVAGAHAALRLSQPPALSTDAATRAALWLLRKGLYATVAAARPSGTSALLEDIAVPVHQLLDTCVSLNDLFDRHGYGESVIFGHAKDGNVHFMLTDRFEGERLTAYRAFTDDMVDLVLAMGGTLKAEHGTGRTMAPFVQRQYGDELYDVMREVKRLFDPDGVLAPGVVIGDDPDAHVRHLKTNPTVEPEVDRCVECGYCEPVCPSRDLTTTPRQRIVLRRALASAAAAGDSALVAELEASQGYQVVDTCAADGMCQTACPVLINTGDLVRRLRAEGQSRTTRAIGRTAARHWSAATRSAAVGLDVAAALPALLPAAATGLARHLSNAVPQWSKDLPAGGRPRAARPSGSATVLFPSCTGALFGGPPGVTSALLALCQRAGVEVGVPDAIADLCCGTPWSSKGLVEGHRAMADRVGHAAREWQAQGATSVVCDASSCTEGLRSLLPGGEVVVLDAVDFALDVLLPRLTVRTKLAAVLVHPTCSTTRAGRSSRLVQLASALAGQVVVPADWGCCAFAGDRGLLVPELTASATQAEAAEIAGRSYDAYLSDNRTCDIGMTRATGRRFRHVVELLEELTR